MSLARPRDTLPFSTTYRPYVPVHHPIFRRSRHGCLVCRARGKRCDRQEPSSSDECSECCRLNIVCLGYSEKRPPWMKDPNRLKAFRAEIRQWTFNRGNTRAQKPLDLRHYMVDVRSDVEQGSASSPSRSGIPVQVEPPRVSVPSDSPGWYTSPMHLGANMHDFLGTPQPLSADPYTSCNSEPLPYFYDPYNETPLQVSQGVATHSFPLPLTHFYPSQHQYRQRIGGVDGMSTYGETTHYLPIHSRPSHTTEPPTSYARYPFPHPQY